MAGKGGNRNRARPSGVPSRTGLLEFRAAQDFRFGPANASPAAEQSGRGGERFLTTSRMFTQQVLLRHPQQFRVSETAASISCLPREHWADTAYRGRRVLFLLPSQALGSNVCTLLFLQAFAEAHKPGRIGVFCAQSASDIYLTSDLATVYSLWLPRKDLKRWDVVIDLGHLESRRDIDIWPVDMEADLLEAFAIPPSSRYSGVARPMRPRDGTRPQIGLLPLASSPLRTLPAQAAVALIAALKPRGDVTLCLNEGQAQGRLYRRALGENVSDIRTVDGYPSIGALLQAIDGFDYLVAADSGPAHMSKLFGTPGLAVYTSAPGDVLQGRFSNLARWTVPWTGPYCRTPCGLAKLRQSTDGRIGCMGSLEVGLEELPSLPQGHQPAVVERLLADPVPCIRALRDAPEELAAAVAADFDRRLADAAIRPA